MPDFNFKEFHIRSINAATDAERAAINQELKAVYASLSEEEKVVFNQQLQQFLVRQYKAIGDEYEALKEGGAFN
ncbi:MAG: hypothetical protein MUF45_03985 [Spirosomaceae bacterium]|jgi:hypothetical protein|nr:hypothetical protein [Spirosomataceae bacterium]